MGPMGARPLAPSLNVTEMILQDAIWHQSRAMIWNRCTSEFRLLFSFCYLSERRIARKIPDKQRL